MTGIRIFSYLPNPRVWKAQITGRLCDVAVEVVGDTPPRMVDWLWDYDARKLEAHERTADSPYAPYARMSRRGFSGGTLYKTDRFLDAHPFGTIPAAFTEDGAVGIFESNSIMRAVARAARGDHGLYGRDLHAASRIDSFLDATLVFARETQVYLLVANEMDAMTRERMASAYEFYLEGVERALQRTSFLAGDELTLADIGFACEIALFLRERRTQDRPERPDFGPISQNIERDYPGVVRHLRALAARPVFTDYLTSYLERSLPI